MNYKSFFVTLAASVVSAVIAAVGTVLWLGAHCNMTVAEVGPGFVAYGCTNAVGDVASANNGTRLEILKRDDDLAFTSDGRLGFNDKATTDHVLGAKPANDNAQLDGTLTAFARGQGKDYTIPLWVMPAAVEDTNVFTSNPVSAKQPCGSGAPRYLYTFKTGIEFIDIANSVSIMYLHVSASGVILGIDFAPDCSDCCRPTTTKK